MPKLGKNSIAHSGLVIPETGELFVMKPVWLYYETVIQSFRDFIKAKPLKEGKKDCIILDKAPWHKKAIRLIWEEEQPEYSDIRDAMTCLSLPPYSPDLNPIEQVWRITLTSLLFFISTQYIEEYLCMFSTIKPDVTLLPVY